MAHNIATINGQSAIAYIGSTPWHGLGTRLRGDLRYSIDQSLAAAGLDWTVSLEPVFDGTGTNIPLGQLARRSSDGAQLSLVGPSYVAVQNRASLSILETAVEELGATIEVIGALGRGERLWALVRLAGATVDVTGEGDSVQGYALLTWSHDGSGAVKIIATGTRAVCQNTIALARAEAHANVASIRHTTSAKSKVEEARKLFTGLTKSLIATPCTGKLSASTGSALSYAYMTFGSGPVVIRLIAGSTSISTSSCDADTLTRSPFSSVVLTNTFDCGNPSGVRSW